MVKLRNHAICLSDIPVSGGTSRNESCHRVLNKYVRRPYIGVEMAIALIGTFIYQWNERKLHKKPSKGVAHPIEYYNEKKTNEFQETFGAKVGEVESRMLKDINVEQGMNFVIMLIKWKLWKFSSVECVGVTACIGFKLS